MDISKACHFRLVHGTKNAEVSDTDTSAFGRIDKVSRIAGSINFNLYKKTKKINGKPKVVFCTSLPHELLYTTFERIQTFASRQSLKRYTYGTQRINLKKYDYLVKSFINTVEVSFESSLNIDGIPDECFLPCHRVIRSDGAVGGYNRGKMKKAEMLEEERTS